MGANTQPLSAHGIVACDCGVRNRGALETALQKERWKECGVLLQSANSIIYKACGGTGVRAAVGQDSTVEEERGSDVFQPCASLTLNSATQNQSPEIQIFFDLRQNTFFLGCMKLYQNKSPSSFKGFQSFRKSD
jgi:hypothetical protein